MRPISLFIAAALAASSSGAYAQATPEGAKAMEAGYAAFLTQAVIDEGLLSVAPEGDDYVVTWNFQKAIDGSKSKGEIQIEPFSYRLTPGPGGAWIFKSAKLPKIAFETDSDKGHSAGVIDFEAFNLDGLFDPAAAPFLRADSKAGAANVALDSNAADQSGILKLIESGVTAGLRAKNSADGTGIDVSVTHAASDLHETIMPRGADEEGGGAADDDADKKQGAEAAAPIMTLGAGRVSGASDLVGLRGHEIGDLWKYVVAHDQDERAPPELKAKLQATLPLWKQISGSAEIADVSIDMAQAKATLKSLSESFRLSGFTEKGIAEFGLTLRDLAVDSSLAPAWAHDFWPASLDMKVTASSDGWDKVAQIALADPNFGAKDFSPETQQQMLAVLMGGHPQFVLAPGSLKSPTVNLTFEGAAGIEATGPAGHAKITADSLDKVMSLVAKLGESDPQAQQIVLVLTFVKGLARNEDGRLAWNVDVDAKGALTVNGQALSKPDAN